MKIYTIFDNVFAACGPGKGFLNPLAIATIVPGYLRKHDPEMSLSHCQPGCFCSYNPFSTFSQICLLISCALSLLVFDIDMSIERAVFCIYVCLFNQIV